MAPIITLTTDFGHDSPYVASMKGVILGINPDARLVDLGHQVPPQDLRHAAYFLATALPCFPPGVIHVVVVDPGVGTDRHLLHVEWNGQQILVPDNGCWTGLAPGNEPAAVRRLTEPRYWRQPVSSTFHGRDILAPVAAHLSLGVAPDLLGPRTTVWVRLESAAPQLDERAREWTGEVVFADHFGNLITNIPHALLAAPGEQPSIRVRVGDRPVTSVVRTYGEAAPGTLIALFSSTGMLEIAVVQGSAAQRLQASAGTPVTAAF